MAEKIFRRDLICLTHVISVFEWGVETEARNFDRESITKKCNGKESRDIKI